MHAPFRPSGDLRRNLSVILHSPASWVWVSVVVVIHLLVETFGGTENLGWWFENFGLSWEGLFAGKIWQLSSYGTLHGDWWHVLFNALLVLLIGSRIEHMAGPEAMVQCTVLGILAGGLSHLLMGAGLLVGLSGGCFALLLLLTTLSPQSRMFPLPLSGRSLGGGLVMAALFLSLINPDAGLPVFSSLGKKLTAWGMGSWFKVGHACHFGGAIAGWLYGRWILRPRVTLARLRRDRARRESL